MAKILYGDCVAGPQSAPVRISALAGAGCELEAVVPDSSIEGDVSLWIGAVGPIAATATKRDREHFSVRFKEPLNHKILYHFNCG